MKTFNETDIDVALVKLSGIALFTAALIILPESLGAVFNMISSMYFLSRDHMEPYAQTMTELNLRIMSMAIGKLLSFVILLLAARWIFGYPKILRKWLNKSEHRLRD